MIPTKILSEELCQRKKGEVHVSCLHACVLRLGREISTFSSDMVPAEDTPYCHFVGKDQGHDQ